VAVIGSPAQTFKTLVSFNGTDGEGPEGAIIQSLDGNLYGATFQGGTNTTACGGYGCGTVFKITPAGKLTTLYSFCAETNCTDGTNPYAGLVQATNGNFYGTTALGGANGYGTVFKITPAGELTTLYSFCAETNCTDGTYPYAGLAQATNGNFYGTTFLGGANDDGTVFEITPGGKLTTVYSFCSKTGCADGAGPDAGLVQATNGNLYGTTTSGGANDDGTVFEITLGAKLTTLHSFDGTDGAYPYARLVQATNGNFYGTTEYGGANSCILGGMTYGCGTVFEMTSGGKLTTLHSFDGSDGEVPYGGLVQATNGKFYGTTGYGGANSCILGGSNSGCGTVFEMTSGGKLTTLYSFCAETSCTDGLAPFVGLVQATSGNLYGTTQYGGANENCSLGCGTVFSLGAGLGPFVETLPTSGKVGAAVIILGNNLTGSTSVTFNGTAATFTVVSSTEIKTTVPSGATTGKVKVVTPHGTLTSNVNFRVT
jgi:uncharacterized repeat protein (TIGR03803 family)